MNRVQRTTPVNAALLAALFWAAPVVAEEDETPSAATISKVASTPPPTAVVPTRTLFGSTPVTSAALARQRGGDRVVNDNQLRGIVADNKASNLTTGMNVISDGAFSGASGLSTVIQNSGNNVLIQNSTIVNVQVK